MIYLKSKGIESLGTVRRNRFKNVPFPSDTVMKSKERGTMYECTATVNEEKITAVLWKDNKLVILLSTFVGMNPVEHVKRFSKKEKKTIMVPFLILLVFTTSIWVELTCWMPILEGIKFQ
jgi:hypothetical protein